MNHDHPINIVQAIAALTTLASATVAAPPPLFDVPWVGYETAVYPEGLDPWDSDVADFNGDGSADLATVSWRGTAYLSILLGDGEGAFSLPATYPLLLESLGVVAGDFDEDGDPDLVVADTGRFWEGTSVTFWRNTGSGAFVRGGSFAAGNSGPSGITSADYNGDGHLDVAVAHDRYIVYGNSMAVLFGRGDGTFQGPQTYSLQEGTRAIDSADLDGDGDTDLLVGHETNRWTFMRNNGGTFASAAVIPGIQSGSIPELPAVHAADVDLDGDQDVMFSNSDSGGVGAGAIGLWRNNGNGTFAGPETLSFNDYTNGGVYIATGDVTGDGWPDILASTYTSHNWFLLPGDGAGGFEPARKYRAGQSPIPIHTPDLDHDGDLDVIVVASQSLQACVYLNPGDGSFRQPDPIDMSSPNIAPAFATNVVSGDIDGDGDLDLVTGIRSDFSNVYALGVRRNNGDGTFAPVEEYPMPTYAVVVRLRDLDGDGDLDLYWVDSGYRIRTRMNPGNGLFGSINSSWTVDRGDVSNLWDVDNDGDLDALVSGFFEVAVLKNDGSGRFAAPIYHALPGFTDALGMGDFDNDGNLDLLTTSGSQGGAQVSFGNGDGTFDPPFEVTTGRDVHAFATADVDRNGTLDFGAIYNLDENGLSIRRGRGNGDFFLLQNYHGSYFFDDQTGEMVFADVDADGWVDALTANFSSQDLSLWRGLPDGTFAHEQRLGVAQQAYDLTYGDFDGDGVGDVAVVAQVNHGAWWYPGVMLFKGTSARNGYGLVLSQNTLQRGQVATFTVSGAMPDETVYFLYSLRGVGSGPCPPQIGGLCLDLLNPIQQVGRVEADASGVARLRQTIPAGAPLGLDVHTQAVVRRGPGASTSIKSNTVSAEVQQ